MRSLIAMLAFVLFAVPAQATTFHSDSFSGEFKVVGPFDDYPYSYVPVQVSYGFSLPIGPPADPFDGPFSYYRFQLVVSHVSGQTYYQACDYNIIAGGCGRYFPPRQGLDPGVTSVENTIKFLVLLQMDGPDLGQPTFSVDFVLPDAFSIAPVPEPSTWAMLLIGFAGIAFLAYHRRDKHPLAPEGALVF